MTAVATAAGRPGRSPVPVTGGSWAPEPGVAVRGRVLLLPGRGEHPQVYRRFGRRLASDGYRLDVATGIGPAEALLRDGGPGPVVVAGTDTGALHAAVLASESTVDALLLAGAASTGPAVHSLPKWSDELDARSACPVHRGRLDDLATRGALAEPVPPDLVARFRSVRRLSLPAVLLHGSADPLAPLAGARRLAARLGADLVVVTDGRHDILNDVSHRSVAAYVVGWLEWLRTGSPQPILTVEPSAGHAR
jgi:alpha-beta hydrolase superfamily lysophospholipase